MATARVLWKERQRQLDPDRLVFIDETGTSTNMARLRGRAPRGQRLIGQVPHGHWKITTIVAALRNDAIIAPFIIDEPMNGDIFAVYLEQCLVPALRPNDIPLSRGQAPSWTICRCTEAATFAASSKPAGASLIYLPPYSPDLNPIEMAFSKLKAPLRKAAERSMPALWDRIGSILDLFSSGKCANYFAHAGYE